MATMTSSLGYETMIGYETASPSISGNVHRRFERRNACVFSTLFQSAAVASFDDEYKVANIDSIYSSPSSSARKRSIATSTPLLFQSAAIASFDDEYKVATIDSIYSSPPSSPRKRSVTTSPPLTSKRRACLASWSAPVYPSWASTILTQSGWYFSSF